MAYIGKQPTVGNFQVCDAISVVNGQAAYTLQVDSSNVSPESANHMIVSLNGVIQKPGSSFTIAGSTITFASNLATGDVIDFITILGDVLNVGTPSDSTITTAKIVDANVTTAKVADDAVTQAKLADESVNEARLQVSNSPTNGYFLSAQSGNTGGLTWAEAGGGYVYKIDNQINNTRAVISAASSKTTLISGTFTNTVASSKVLVQIKMPNYGTADGSMGIGFTYNGTDYDGAITQSQEDTDQTSFSMMNKGFTNPASTGSINWVIYFKTAGGASKRPFKTVNPNTTDDSDLPQQETQITFMEYTA